MFAPAEGRIVGDLSGQHERGVTDFRFSQAHPGHGFSLGGDGKLIQWDINGRKALRTVSLPETGINTLAPITLSTSILCASSTPYLVFPESQHGIEPQSFDAMKNPVHALYRSSPTAASSDEFFLATDGDRYVNIYDTAKQRLARTLIASSEIKAINLDAGDAELTSEREQQMLLAVNKHGVVELFPKPFVQPSSHNGDLKSSRKSLTQKSSAQVKLTDPSSRPTAIFAASVQGPEILLASVDGGIDLSFQKVRWQDEGSGELLFTGTKELVKAKSVASITVRNGVEDKGKPHVDESSTVVTNGLGVAGSQDAAIEIESSGEEEEADDESASDADADDASEASDEDMTDAPPATSQTLVPATSDPTGEELVATEAEPAEPSFADRLAALHPKTIDIPSTSSVQPLVTSGHLSLPTGMSLSTVLTQSLRTNDAPLLEACLHTPDPAIVRNTLTRLDPSLASILIQKLAERIVSRPGRYGGLQVWVQHLCVAHGASISQNPAARESLKTLYYALDQRASGLPSLLLLKGKLQMVEGQLRFRREIAAQRAEAGIGGAGRPINVMVEGAGDNWESEDDYDEAVGSKPNKRARKALDDLVAGSGSEDEDADEEMPRALTNGVSDDSSDNEEHSSDEEDVQQRARGLVDEEAEEELDSGSDNDEDDGSELGTDDEAEETDDDEDDDEMDSFINDGEISVEDNDALLDDAPPEEDDDVVVEDKPKTKRRKA